MPGPFQWEDQPEAAGPMSEPHASGGVALDIQALRQRSIRLPQLNEDFQAAGELVPRSAGSPYIDHDPQFQAAERLAAVRRHLASQASGRDALRTLLDSAARGAGVDPAIARDLSDELARLLPVGVVTVDEPAADEPKEAAK